MKSKNQVIKIIFNIKNRSDNLTKYLNLLCNCYQKDICFDLLIINEKNNKFINGNFNKINIINTTSYKKLNGMNSIFREIYNARTILKKYKYCCFVEDDNFIFPISLVNSKLFLDNNPNYIACSGKKFIYSLSNNKYCFVNKYLGPNTNDSNILEKRYLNYNGALCYYSLFRKNVFLKILKFITKIEDDNLSEILFNFLTIKFGKIKTIKSMYLARKYPRPQIYNIPHKTKWILKNKLNKDLNFIMQCIDFEYNTKLLDLTIYNYLSSRFKKLNKPNFFDKIIYITTKYQFYFLNYKIITKFLKNVERS